MYVLSEVRLTSLELEYLILCSIYNNTGAVVGESAVTNIYNNILYFQNTPVVLLNMSSLPFFLQLQNLIVRKDAMF
jgi:hypothetical protein